jgi:uncharacterized protein (TIGR03086 family)
MTWVHAVVANVRADQLEDSTPCEDWNVGGLIAHMTDLTKMARSSILSNSSMWNLIDEDAEGDADPVAAFLTASEQLNEVLADRANWKRSTFMPPAMLSTGSRVAANLVNQLGHGWDLAVATGQDAAIPPEVAAPLEVFAQELFTTMPLLTQEFGAVVPVDATAQPGERLVALLGRDPALRTPIGPKS